MWLFEERLILPLITQGPIRLYLLKGPLSAAHENISLEREVQWSWNL